MNSDVALIMLDIPVVQCGSVNAEGNFLSLNHVSQTEVAILLILAHTSYLSQISHVRHVEKKSAMWRNFRFIFMANGEKSEKCSGMLDFST